jgi:hypothetical protein
MILHFSADARLRVSRRSVASSTSEPSLCCHRASAKHVRALRHLFRQHHNGLRCHQFILRHPTGRYHRLPGGASNCDFPCVQLHASGRQENGYGNGLRAPVGELMVSEMALSGTSGSVSHECDATPPRIPEEVSVNGLSVPLCRYAYVGISIAARRYDL